MHTLHFERDRLKKSVKPKLLELARTREGYATSYDGTRIWYRSVGKGVPIICSNGLGCSTFYFSYLEEYFKKNFQVITWDYRGHGKSELPKDKKNHTIQSLQNDLKAVMDELGIKKAIMVGHSMGTQVLYEFYKNMPGRCMALIPCFGTFEKPMDTFLNSPLSKYVFEVVYLFNQFFPKVSNMMGTFMVKNPLWFRVGGMLKIMQPYMVDRKIMEQYVDHIINVDPIFLSDLTRNMQQHTAEASLKKIKVPTLILGAEDDTFTPVWLSKKMHHLIPKSELFIVKKGSHVALVEQPELINFRIEKFIHDRGLSHSRSDSEKFSKAAFKSFKNKPASLPSRMR